MNHIDRPISLESQKERNPRGCTEYSKPLIVLLILFFSAFAFYILEVQHHITQSKAFDSAEYVLIGSYTVIWLLSIWSLYVMVMSCPGYIPYNYKYQMDKMSHRDRLIYEHLRTALHSTLGQQNEMFTKGYDHGSIRAT